MIAVDWCHPCTVTRTPISARLPKGSGALAEHDASIEQVDHLAVAGRRGRTKKPSTHTERAYGRWLRIFQAWCAERGYQTDLLLSLNDRTAEEFAEWLVVDTEDRPRYTPNSVRQALGALRYWAAKRSLDPQPSFNAAYGVLHNYVDHLAQQGVVASRQELRIRPGDPVG